MGKSIIDLIDGGLNWLRKTYRHYKAEKYHGPVHAVIKKLERYFILSGGVALALGLTINTNWWPWRVRIIYHDPIIHVDWDKFVSKMKLSHADGSWIPAINAFGISASTASLGYVVYRLEWNSDWQKSMEYMQSVKAMKGISVTSDMVGDWALSGRLRMAKQVYGYSDGDTNRTDLPETYRPSESRHFINSLTKSPSMAILPLVMHTSEFDKFKSPGQDFLADVFHRAAETIPDKAEKSHFYESLREASIFYTPVEIRNDGHSPAANVKIAISLADQEIVQALLDEGSVSKGERTGALQILNIPVLPAGESRAILLKSTSRPLPASGFILQERPIVTQVADYWNWILLTPLPVLLF